MLQKQNILGVLIIMFMSTSANADLSLIGNIESDVGSLDVQSVKRIFLGERQAFPNGLKAIPLHHSAGSPDRNEFFDAVLNMSESSHKRHWSRMRSTGRGNSPAELSSYDELLNQVKNNPGSITYINSDQVNDSVKVLLTVKGFDGV